MLPSVAHPVAQVRVSGSQVEVNPHPLPPTVHALPGSTRHFCNRGWQYEPVPQSPSAWHPVGVVHPWETHFFPGPQCVSAVHGTQVPVPDGSQCSPPQSASVSHPATHWPAAQTLPIPHWSFDRHATHSPAGVPGR